MIPAAKLEIGPEEVLAVQHVLESGMLAQGPEVEAFEREFATVALDGLKCVAVNSGTSALHLSLVALGIGSGDEVLVPSFTFAATANAVAFAGATPVFVDIDPRTFNIDPIAAESLISDRTRAIIPVHLYGQPADLTSLTQIANNRGLSVIEDASQAHCASWEGRRVGTWGTVGTFSFYPTKNMTAGEGGMIATSSDMIEKTTRLLRNQGQARRYENEVVGLNNRMSDIHASIGRVQLKSLLKRTLQRQANALFYNQNLSGVELPWVHPDAEHVYHQYTIRIPEADREQFVEALARRGVGTGVYYPIPVHRLPAYDQHDDLPETEKAAREVLSLPVYPSLTDRERDLVVDSVNAVARAGA